MMAPIPVPTVVYAEPNHTHTDARHRYRHRHANAWRADSSDARVVRQCVSMLVVIAHRKPWRVEAPWSLMLGTTLKSSSEPAWRDGLAEQGDEGAEYKAALLGGVDLTLLLSSVEKPCTERHAMRTDHRDNQTIRAHRTKVPSPSPLLSTKWRSSDRIKIHTKNAEKTLVNR